MFKLLRYEKNIYKLSRSSRYKLTQYIKHYIELLDFSIFGRNFKEKKICKKNRLMM